MMQNDEFTTTGVTMIDKLKHDAQRRILNNDKEAMCASFCHMMAGGMSSVQGVGRHLGPNSPVKILNASGSLTSSGPATCNPYTLHPKL